MKVITLATQKGGCGKTTLATNLAVMATAGNRRVLLVDLDPQATAKDWWESRDADAPSLVHIQPSELAKAFEVAASNFDTVIVDTPGRASLDLPALFARSDFVLVPCQPSKADIRAQKTTVFTLDQVKCPAAFVLTRCPPTGKRPDAARSGLESFGYPVLATYITNRAAYQDAYAVAKAVIEHEPDGKAAQEIAALWGEIERRMKKHGQA
jgi:chromosome partitioning protein